MSQKESSKYSFILYFHIIDDDSLDARNRLADHLKQFGFKWMDMTGGQAAFKDGDFEIFSNETIKYCRQNDLKIHFICRCPDFGVGLIVLDSTIDKMIEDNVMTFPQGAILAKPTEPTEKDFPWDYRALIIPTVLHIKR